MSEPKFPQFERKSTDREVATDALESIMDTFSRMHLDSDYELEKLSEYGGVAQYQILKTNRVTKEQVGASDKDIREILEQTVFELGSKHEEEGKSPEYWDSIISTKPSQAGGVLITIGQDDGLMSEEAKNKFDVTEDFARERMEDSLEKIKNDALQAVNQAASWRGFKVMMLDDSRYSIRFVLKNPDGTVASSQAHQDVWAELLHTNENFDTESTELLEDDDEGSAIQLKLKTPLR